MKVTLCTFTRSGAEAELGPDLATTVRTALNHYSDKLRSGRPPVCPPRFIAAGGYERAPEEETLDLEVAPEVEAVLRAEARRQEIDLDTLAAHTVLVYLAELDFLGTPARLA
jgi:hypothetical protein